MEVAEEIEESFAPFCEPFLAVSLNFMDPNTDDNILQYACGCIGQALLYGKLPEAVANEIWSRVNLLMDADSSRSLLFDSLYGLIAQLVLSYPNLKPVDQVSLFVWQDFC